MRFGKSKPYDGYIDVFDNGRLRGWAFNSGNVNAPVEVSFYHNGRRLGSATADHFRGDLHQNGLGNGKGLYGFSFEIPIDVRKLGNYSIEARVDDARFELGHSPFPVSEKKSLAFRTRGEHIRDFFAAEYIHGQGIEIGALHKPMKVPEGSHVTYVDSLSTEQLKHLFQSEVAGHEVVDVGIVTDAHTLKEITSGSQDFVIANQVVEHLENPLLALENMLRVLKEGGILFISLPDKRYTFDCDRPLTEFAHVLKDYREGPSGSRKLHYREWVRLVEKVTGDQQVEKRAEELEHIHKYAIHFHVWTQFEMFELFAGLRKELGISMEVEASKANDYEALFLVRKLGPSGRT